MLLYEFFQKKKPRFLAFELQRIIFPESQTLLDVGCGGNSIVQLFNKRLKESVGIDLFENSIKMAKEKGIHDSYTKCNVLDIDKYFKPKSFDCVLSVDVIEHLEKNKAIELIRKMEDISKKYIVIQTPNGYLYQGAEGGNPYQTHKCGFTYDELKKFDYNIIGMDGPKFLRGKCAEIRWKPKILFSILSNILDPFYRFFPKRSFNLLAYKKTG